MKPKSLRIGWNSNSLKIKKYSKLINSESVCIKFQDPNLLALPLALVYIIIIFYFNKLN